MVSHFSRVGSATEPQGTIAAGRAGEDSACRFLRAAGYAIQARNVRIGRDEIDIVAFDPFDDVLVFCEVKARTKADGDFTPALGITLAKKARMLRAARGYVGAMQWLKGYRLDALLLAGGTEVLHLRELTLP